MTEPSPFAILKWGDFSQAKSKHSDRELWQRQCAESSTITDRGKRVPISLRIVANALKKREIRQFNLNIFLCEKLQLPATGFSRARSQCTSLLNQLFQTTI